MVEVGSVGGVGLRPAGGVNGSSRVPSAGRSVSLCLTFLEHKVGS